MEIPVSYKEHEKRTFVQGLREINRHALEPCGLDHVVFGPTYQVNTSKGAPLSVFTVNIKKPFDYPPAGETVDRAWFFLAMNESGEIVGYRMTVFQRDKDEIQNDYWYATGTVATAERATGIAMLIELAHFDILKRIAVLDWQPVVYRVEDGNLEQLKALREQLQSKPTEELKRLIEERETEHKRWLDLYGPQGRLGFDQRGIKEFVRQDEDFLYETPLDNLDIVRLDRTDEREMGLRGVYSLPQHTELDPSTLQAVKRAKYENDILPKIRKIILQP